MQTAVLPSATLSEFYRFAVLLAGNAKVAERIMAEVLSEVKSQIDQLRNENSRRVWLATHIRQRCLDEKPETPPAPGLLRETGDAEGHPEVLKIEAFLLAQRVHALPEPERTALALFYLDFFSTEEIGKILKLDAEQLAATIGRARSLLRDSLRAMRKDSPLPS